MEDDEKLNIPISMSIHGLVLSLYFIKIKKMFQNV